MRKLAFIMLWLYVFSLPWEHSLELGDKIGSISRVLGIVVIGTTLAAVLARSGFRKLTAFHATAVLYILLVIVSFFWTVDGEATLAAVRTYVQAMWVLWSCWELALLPQQRDNLMFAYVAGACISSLDTIRVYFLSDLPVHSGVRFSAEGWNPNTLALTLDLAIPMAAYLIVSQRREPARFICLGCLVMAPFAIVLTASRAGAVTMVIAAISVPLVIGANRIWKKIAALLLLLAIAAAMASYAPSSSWDRIATTKDELATGDMNDRGVIWRAGLRTFMSKPEYTIVGLGADGFLNGVKVNYVAHNTYLSVLVNNGIVGLAVFVALLFQVARAMLRIPGSCRIALGMTLLCWAVGVTTGSWEEQRNTWFLFGLIYASGFINVAHKQGVSKTAAIR